MKKRMCIVAVALVFATIMSTNTFVNAEEYFSDSSISSSELNRLSANNVVTEYFAERNDFINRKSNDISLAVPPIVEDELSHRDQMDQSCMSVTNSEILIKTAEISDNIAKLSVSETITYVDNGVTKTEVILHDIGVFRNSDGITKIVRDGYKEIATDFISCSYITPDGSVAVPQQVGGSQYCIISTADREVGYTEYGNNGSKYGEYYGNNNQPWCAMFVSWCADHANISTSVIRQTASCTKMRNQFYDQGNYFRSAAYGGSTTPRAGDIIFFNGDPSSPNHVGIVKSVNNGKVYYIAGNENNAVRSDRRSLTSSDIVCYGRPRYNSSGHIYDSTWRYDPSHHWKECINCHTSSGDASHTFRYNSSTQKYTCTVCGYATYSIPVTPSATN